MQVVDELLRTGRKLADTALKDFELVRIYHPDKADSTIPSEEAHARFQSIKTAYDTLRGQTPLANSSPSQNARYPTATWRARSRHQELYTGKKDDWKDHVILAGIVATILILVSQVFATRRQMLMRAHHPQKTQTPVAVSDLDAQDPDRRLGE